MALTVKVGDKPKINARMNVSVNIPANLQEKTVKPTKEQQVVTADEGYDALSRVTVKAPKLQEKTVTPSTSVSSVLPDSNYVGLSKVTVNGVTSMNIKLSINGATGAYNNTTYHGDMSVYGKENGKGISEIAVVVIGGTSTSYPQIQFEMHESVDFMTITSQTYSGVAVETGRAYVATIKVKQETDAYYRMRFNFDKRITKGVHCTLQPEKYY